MNDRPIFAIEQDGDRWYLVTRTPLAPPEPLRLMSNLRELALLTSAERKVFDSVSDGKTNKEIAADLSMTIRMVKFHVSSILRKTGCSDRYDLFHQFGGRGADRG